MPEPNSYLFKHKELLEMLIKKADVHEGTWTLTANFGFGAGNMGPNPEEVSPGAMIALLNVGIQRALPDSPQGLTLNAAEVNPAKSSK